MLLAVLCLFWGLISVTLIILKVMVTVTRPSSGLSRSGRQMLGFGVSVALGPWQC